MKMNEHGGEDCSSPCCSFHPKERVVGICALCLRERLLDLALKRGHRHHNYIPNKETSTRPFRPAPTRRRTTTTISLPRVFLLGSFLRLDTRRPDDDDSDRGSIASLDESFISIKFEDDGESSWESKKKKKEKDSATTNIVGRQQGTKALMENPRPRPTSLRWRKRMDQLLQLVRWKRTSSASATTGHAAMAAKSEVGWRRRKKRWMMSLTATRKTRD